MVNERDLLLDVIEYLDGLTNDTLWQSQLENEERDRMVEGLQEMYDKLEDGN